MQISMTTESHVIVKLQVETGDDYCKRNNIKEIDILKIDVEAEHLVLRGFSEMLENGLIKLIQFESMAIHTVTLNF